MVSRDQIHLYKLKKLLSDKGIEVCVSPICWEDIRLEGTKLVLEDEGTTIRIDLAKLGIDLEEVLLERGRFNEGDN